MAKMRWSGDKFGDERLSVLQSELEPLAKTVAAHPIYEKVLRGASVPVFMSNHIFAVWDFMSVAKALQASLTCTTVPWVPVATPEIRRFVNELILEEESDVHPAGGFTSHFELYMQAMEQRGVSTQTIRALLDAVRNGDPMMVAIDKACLPTGARRFVAETWSVIEGGNAVCIAAFFAFGRETLIPAMFSEALRGLPPVDKPDLLEEYFSRHIELDGDSHGPMAMRMLTWLCGDDEHKWRQAEESGRSALEARIALWDDIVAQLESL